MERQIAVHSRSRVLLVEKIVAVGRVTRTARGVEDQRPRAVVCDRRAAEAAGPVSDLDVAIRRFASTVVDEFGGVFRLSDLHWEVSRAERGSVADVSPLGKLHLADPERRLADERVVGGEDQAAIVGDLPKLIRRTAADHPAQLEEVAVPADVDRHERASERDRKGDLIGADRAVGRRDARRDRNRRRAAKEEGSTAGGVVREVDGAHA